MVVLVALVTLTILVVVEFVLSFLHERHVGVGTTYKGTVGSLSNVSICGGGGRTNRGVIRGCDGVTSFM